MKHQRGSIELIAIGIVFVVAVVAVGAMLHTYNGAIERAKDAEQRAKVAEDNGKTLTTALNDQKLENQQMKLQKEKDDALDAARKRANQQIADYRRKVDAQLNALAKNSPEVRTWMDTSVPPAVIALVRQQPPAASNNGGDGKNGKGKDTGKVVNANPGAGVARSADKRPVVRTNPLIRSTP